MEKYELISKDVRERFQIYPTKIILKCNVCGAKWGKNLDPGRQLTVKDLTCKDCLLETISSMDRQ